MTLHETAVFDVPVTVAVNCCVPPIRTCAFTGVTVTETGGTIVTEAVPDTEESAVEVAVTVIAAGFGMAEGAV
jgi:hypothetical protein